MKPGEKRADRKICFVSELLVILSSFLEERSISFFFTWFYVCLDVDLGEKKDFYIVNFFFTKIADPGEKKDLYIVIFFFTKNHVFWWKKSLLCKNLFFHQVLRFEVSHENVWKKSFLSIIFFFTKFYVAKNFSEI